LTYLLMNASWPAWPGGEVDPPHDAARPGIRISLLAAYAATRTPGLIVALIDTPLMKCPFTADGLRPPI